MSFEHISTIVERVSADLANRYARAARHDLHCPFWQRIDPSACNCSCRPMIDLLLHIAERKAA